MRTSRLFFYNLLNRMLPETRCFGFRTKLLAWCGVTIGQDVRISASVIFNGTGEITIGDDVWIGPGCYLSAAGSGEIRIGNHVDLGPSVMMFTGSHSVDIEGEHIGGKGTSASVSIGDGCWLGARSVILPGVSLPEKTLVAAGAVVTKSITTSYCLLAGVPAEVRKRYR